MFPSFDFDTTIKIIEEEIQSNITNLGDVFLMEFVGNKATIVLENGIPKKCKTLTEKLQMYTQILLRTKLDKYKVYKDTGFGLTYFNFLGNNALPISLIASDLKRELTEQLTKLSVVNSISDFTVERNGSKLLVEFTINKNINISEVV